MGSVTAQLLIGYPPQWQGGIDLTHVAFLSENDRPAWILAREDFGSSVGQEAERVVWISTIEHMLEDALLMVAVCVEGDPELTNLLSEKLGSPPSDRLELASDLREADLVELRGACQALDHSGYMCVLRVLEESTIRHQLDALEGYKLNIDVFAPH
jgi:hypothetical protein